MQDCDTALPTSSSIRQGSHSLGPLCLLSWLILNLAGGGYADQSVELPEIARQAIEADWAQQDATRVAQLVEPGTIRLPGKVIEWPGLPRGSVPTIPETPSPTLDGRLDDPCWEHALKLEPPQNGDPSYLLCHDGEMLYVGVTIPAASEARFRGPLTSVDAAGAVDGVKDGRYAFHTGGDVKPWWQVDLGRSERIGRIVVYNRLDYQPGLHNADHLLILASNDGETWRLIHENLQHFGGITGAPPLQVQFDNLEARFIRLQIAEDRPILFHLDEVEIYSAEEPDRNLALHKLATQSTLSIWSRGGPLGSAYFMIGGARMGLTLADPPRVTLNDRVVGYSAATRTEGGIVVKFALALRTLGETFPSEVYLAGQIKQPVRLGGRWQVTWPPRLALSYGWNRLVLNIEAAAPFDPPLRATIETVGLTPFALHRRQVGQAVVNGPGPLVLEFPVEVEGAAAVIVTMDQGLTSLTEARPFFVPPVRETVRRGQALLRDFGRPAPIEFRKLRARLRELECRETTQGADLAARQALYREARWLVRDIAFSNPALDFDSLLFVKRHTQQTYPDVCLNHMPWTSRPGGDICVLSPLSPTGTVTPLLRGALGPGHVHGMDLSPDGKRVAFGYARRPTPEPPSQWLDRAAAFVLRQQEEPIHIFEMDLAEGRPRQLTDGEWSDLDPAYLPNGDIAFVSERCAASLQCNEYDKDETSCNLYAVQPDTREVRRLTVSKDGDYLPHLLDNGLLAYTRWEYQERNWANIQSIWYVAPDGTGADALYKQHMNNPWALEEMRSIPHSHKLVAIATGHHTLPAGPVVIVDPHVGLNNPQGLTIVTPGTSPPEGGMDGDVVPEGGVPGANGHYMTPWPLTDKHFLVSYTFGPQTDENGYALYLIDVHGTRELIYRDPNISCTTPIPWRARPRPLVPVGALDPIQERATCVVTDVYEGLEGIERGAIKYLRIARRLQWPYNLKEGGHRYEPDVKSVMVNWTPAQVIGTVPVERDGSAYFQVPAGIAVYFQALDENYMELRRMRSFINFQPGEFRSCAGCHETRAVAPANVPSLQALRRPPSPWEPAPWGDKPVSFLRDIQPVFDSHCVACHSGLKPAGGLDLSGGLTERYNRAYETINAAGLVARSNIGDDAQITAPLAFGSHKSKLIDVVRSGHKGRVNLSDQEILKLIIWVDLNAPYDAEFINKRPAVQPYNMAADVQLRQTIEQIHTRRCASCHEPIAVSRLDWIDLRAPERTRFLQAPLAVSAGGLGRCAEVYGDTNDADYRTVWELVSHAVKETWERPRRDVVTLLTN